MVKVHIIFYSLYGHIFRLAEAVLEGVNRVSGVEGKLYQVQETLPDDVIEKMGAVETKKLFEQVPIADTNTLEEADAVIFGAPTRFGMMPAQMRAYLDRTGKLWSKGSLVDKIGSVFTSSGTQHGGQESTILSFHVTLLHHGMILAGVPYNVPEISISDEISGGGPYGASTIAGDGSRYPSENELKIARIQGERVAKLAKRLKG